MLPRVLLARRPSLVCLAGLLAACGDSGGSSTPTEQEPLPVITLSDASLSFAATAGAADPAPRAVELTNGGGGSLRGLSAAVTYGNGQPTGWLTATLSAATAPATLTVQPATGALGAGTYDAAVELRSDMANVAARELPVTFAVSPPPSGWVALQTASTFKPHPPSFVRLAADDERVVVFYGFVDPALSILDQAEVVEWRRASASWSQARYHTNNARTSPDVAIAGSNGFAVIANTDELDARGGIVDNRGSFGLGVVTLENQNEPSVAGALGTAFYSFIAAGRLHVRYSIAHAQDTDLLELTGGLGQHSGSSTCVLTLSCILETSMAGDAGAWYAAMVEAAGCISVQKATVSSYSYVGPCFRASQAPRDPQLHIRGGKPTIVFREGDALYVGEWTGSAWAPIGTATVSAATVVRSAAVGDQLVVLTMNAAGSGPRVHVDTYDGVRWSGFPEGIETTGATLTDVDVAIHRGSAVVGLLENGRVAIRLFVPPAATASPGRSIVRAPLAMLELSAAPNVRGAERPGGR